MSIGPRVRRSLGRFERPATDLYRSLFINLDAFVEGIRRCAGSPRRVLEIGCGAGIVTEHLARAFPDADVTGIDICGQPGWLCANQNGRTRFLRMTAAELCATHPQPYQLVVIGDVLHHVSPPNRAELLARAAELIADGGVVVLKEWVRQRSLAYVMGYCSDRFITGDDVHFMDEEQLRAMVLDVFGSGSVQSHFHVSPWTCNLALVIKPSAARGSATTES
jgi:2-polyprenyl-3-methyl-5-hydroxy-6-metoxy-1,4-benzoquinol methylase